MRRSTLIMFLFLAAISKAGAQGSEPNAGNNEDAPQITFFWDNPIVLGHIYNKSFAYSVKAEVETKKNVNFDLNSGNKDNYHDILPKLIGSAVYEPDDLLRFYAEAALSQNFILENPNNKNADVKLEIKEAYLTFRNIIDGVSLSAGREYIGDEREWLFDEELDGASLRLNNNFMGVELAYRQEGIFQQDIFQSEEKVHPEFYFARGYFAVDNDNTINPFLIYQDGHEEEVNENLLFLGVQSILGFGKGLDGWVDGAIVVGEASDGREVQGFGFDVGLTKTIEKFTFRPYFTGSLAYGSGDDGSGKDTAFRQTSVQGNSDRFGGVTSLNYYGEVLDPELSNLGIITLGVGVRPTPRTSVDLVYHRYIQSHLQDEFRDVAIDEDPDGENYHIGDELDLVVGFKEIKMLDLSLATGVFLPGLALDRDDPAFFAKLRIIVDL